MHRLPRISAAVFVIVLLRPAHAQDQPPPIAPFISLMSTMVQQGMQQEQQRQELERQRNSPEYRNQEIQPGGLTRGQVIIVQQKLLERNYDVGEPDGVIGPKTMSAVATLQRKAGVPITGYPTPELLEALLQE